MKIYEEPKLTVEQFDVEDIVTASFTGEGGGGDGNVGGEIFD